MLTGNTVQEKIYNFLVSKGYTPSGACGLMANLKAESGLNPQNLQNSGNNKLGLTDEQYTNAVDDGSYTIFVRDALGYGLAQWTYWSRKQNMFNFIKGMSASIGDLEAQLEYLVHELDGYTVVKNILTTAESIKEASDIVLTQYEKPADQSNGVKEKRASYGQAYYDELVSGNSQEVKEDMTESQLRQKVVDTAVAWYGRKESDGSHKVIIDTYNDHKPLARGYKVKYTDSWCATFGSAVAIVAGLTAIIPTECGCGQMIALFQAINRWIENDAYIPSPGDYIFYDWDDNGVGDDTGWPEHVGIVISVSGNTIKVIEGNKSDSVLYREIAVNGKFIRGYGVPDYGSLATASDSGSTGGANSGSTGSSSGGSLCMTPQFVGEVTASTLNIRKWAGTEYDKLKSYPHLSQGTQVEVCDSVKASDGVTWYYIRIDGKVYGFASSEYIKKETVSGSIAIKTGMVVNFKGSKHYVSSQSTSGKTCKPGKATVTAVAPGAKHPYHIVRTSGSASTVYGWVNESDVTV